MTPEHIKRYRRAYFAQRRLARQRNILWLFDSFEQWLDWWGEDIVRRGRRRGQLVMARYNDTGPYHPENVRKITCGDNVREAQIDRPQSAHTRALRSRTLRGHTVSAATRQLLSVRAQGRPGTTRSRCLTPQGLFDSIGAARSALGITRYQMDQLLATAGSGYERLPVCKQSG
ncbi:hypothetical protein UFOVP700_13 [uncultured Caudovirales phage]|uniref:Uncharacterized protein n=1 Tax=uncultured Caudovirales phage TaxID=2100421 RepID=A0A6J5NMV1_9CAUD|nr:hypothetical protein UFOVP700_13 [uncultured Caudovirales phage]